MQADLDVLLRAYKEDPHQLDPLLRAVTDTARHIAGKIGPQIDEQAIGQQVALDVWKRLPSITDKLTGLVVTMTRRRTVEAQRRIRKNEASIETYTEILPPAETLTTEDLHRIEIAEQVLGEEVVHLLGEGCSFREIGDELGIPAATLRSKARKVRNLATKRAA